MFEVRPVDRPYPGLRPFESWESSIFFGREAHTDRLLEILQAHHFLVVTGPSGSGKSSLVRAGLIPALPLGTIGRGGAWRLALMRPGDRPLRRLAQAMLAIDSDAASDDSNLAHLQAELARGPRGLADWVAGLRRQARGHDFDILLLVDQFEEIFTYAQAGGRDVNEADAFVNLLLSAAQVRDSGIHVVLTMRTDFLGHCTRFQALPDTINQTGFLTPRLSRSQLEQAIAAPARVFGGDLTPELSGELANAVCDDPDQLPVLQHALARIWDRRVAAGDTHPLLSLKDLQAAGGIDLALSQHADEVLGALQGGQAVPAARATYLRAQWLFRLLSEQRSAEAGGQLVRRPQTLQRIADASGCNWADFVPLLMAFAQPTVSFVTYAGEPGAPAHGADTVVDISHEALLRQWGQVKVWIGAETRAAAHLRALQRRAALDGALLSGPDLALARQWFDSGLGLITEPGISPSGQPTAAWAQRYPADGDFAALMLLYARSTQEATQQARRSRRLAWTVRGSVVLLFVLGATASGVGLWGYQKAVDANAQALWHRLRFDNRPGLSSEDQAQGLLALARAERGVRREAASKWLRDGVLARQLAMSQGYVLRAALGIDSELREELQREVVGLAGPLSQDLLYARAHAAIQLEMYARADLVLQALIEGGDAWASTRLAGELKGFAGHLEGMAAQAWLTQALAGLQTAGSVDRLAAMVTAMARVSGDWSDAQADAVIAAVTEPLARVNAAQDIETLGQAQEIAASKLSATQQPRLVARLLDLAAAHPHPDRLLAITRALGPANAALTPAQIDRYVALVQRMMRQDEDLRQRGQQMTYARRLAAKVSQPLADGLAESWVSGMVQRRRAGTTEVDDPAEALASSLNVLVNKVSAAEVIRLAQRLVGVAVADRASFLKEYKSRGSGYERVDWQSAMVGLAQRLPAEDLQRVVAQLKSRPPMPVARQRGRVSSLSADSLYALSDLWYFDNDGLDDLMLAGIDKLAEPDAERATRVLLTRMASDSDRRNDRQPPAAKTLASDVAEQLIGGLLDPKTGPRSEESSLEPRMRRLTVLAARLDEQQSDRLIRRVLDALGAARRPQHIDALLQCLAALVRAPVPAGLAEAVAAPLVDVLTRPSSDADLVPMAALRKTLEAVAPALSDQAALQQVDRLLAAIAAIGPERRSADDLGEGLSILVAQRHAAQQALLAERLLKAFGQNRASIQILALDQGLQAAAFSLPADQSSRLAYRMLDDLQQQDTGLGGALTAVTASELSLQAITHRDQAKVWIELCKSPFVRRDQIVQALRKLEAGGPPDSAGEGAYLAWAAQRHGVDTRASLMPSGPGRR